MKLRQFGEQRAKPVSARFGFPSSGLD